MRINLFLLSFFIINLFFLSSNNVLFAQQEQPYLKLQGRVVDGQSGEPLPFASIIIPGKGLGGSTNSEGVFTFKIPMELQDDTLKVTYMGYESYVATINDLARQKLVIKLQPKTVILQEAVVRPWDAKEILKEAVEKIPENYFEEPSNITFFYRGKAQSNKEYIEYAEGVFRLHNDLEKNNASLSLLKGRQSICKPVFEQMGIDLTLKGSHLIHADIVHHLDQVELLDKQGFKNHDFWVDGITHLDTVEVYEISFKQNERKPKKALYQGKIYVETNSKAIVRIEFGLSSMGKPNAKVWKGRNKVVAMFLGIDADYEKAYRRTDYRPYQGKWILEKSIHKFAYEYTRDSPSIESLLEIEAEYLVTHIQPGEEIKEEGKEDIRKKENALENFENFSGDYWDHYNIIAETDDTEEILKEIRRINMRYQLPEQK